MKIRTKLLWTAIGAAALLQTWAVCDGLTGTTNQNTPTFDTELLGPFQKEDAGDLLLQWEALSVLIWERPDTGAGASVRAPFFDIDAFLALSIPKETALQRELRLMREEKAAKAAKVVKEQCVGESHGKIPVQERPSGMFCLGYALSIFDKDESEAYRLFSKSAELGHVGSKVNLGILHFRGFSTTEPDYDVAFRYFLEAANLGDPTAQLAVARFYWNGLGSISRSRKDAYFWYQKAASSGSRMAKYELSLLHNVARISGKQDCQKYLFWANAAGYNENDPEYDDMRTLTQPKNWWDLVRPRLIWWSTDNDLDYPCDSSSLRHKKP